MALAIGSPVAAQSVKAGIDAWHRNDPAAAVSIWKPLAAKGDPDAQFNLGQAYKLGRGVPINLALAQGWFERAARQGHVDAETSLGLMLFQNGNRQGGMRWLKAAAEAGEARALLVYGTALYNGDGVPADPVTAYAFISRAAAQGLGPARETLAQMDEAMPVELRKRGVALAQSMARPKEKPAQPAKLSRPNAQAAMKTPPLPPPPATPARKAAAMPAAAADGGWRIQLGAFSQRGSAEALFRKLSGGALAGRTAYYVPAGTVTRLQAGPFPNKAAATSACAVLSRSGQPCFPVPGR